MALYSIFGVLVDSEIELPELPLATGIPDVIIHRSTWPWEQRTATLDEEHVFNATCGAFRILHGREILVDAPPPVNAQDMRVMLLGRVMAFLLRQRGWLPLHASGVMIEGEAVLFLGPSGAGKSTTAAAFHSRGHTVITDDVAPVRVVGGRCLMQPGQPRLRLLQESLPVLDKSNLHGRFDSDKHSFDLGTGEIARSLPLRRIYVLDKGPEVAIEMLPRVVAAAALYRHSFVKPRRSLPEVVAAQLRQCAAVAGLMPIHRLVRVLTLQALPSLVRTVETDVFAKSAPPEPTL